ncbi:Xaa-Pro dipeptidyl-peptidase [Lacticaseibacillus sp. N501-2]|uniref:Xaa-Pro dipeptidyl-peptidase n=1 Tax=Lacticaseibacillus salsurae TaxID=3367729 RepID=UPI0038B2531E
MKLNQYGRLTPDLATQLHELNQIGFNADADLPFAQSVTHNYRLLFPEALNATQQAQALTTIALDDHQTLATWLASTPTQMTRTQFYAVALQLLGFKPEFKTLNTAISQMQAAQLPVVKADLTTTTAWLEALYLLLNTRTPKLVTYLDDLANRGFYKDFQAKHNTPQYLLFNGKSQAVFDPRQLIREVVWVESDLDTDDDGQRDLLETTIFRPQATDLGIKMPALFTANPYFHGTNDQQVEAATHVPESTLAVKTVSHTKADVTYHAPQAPSLPDAKAQSEAQTATSYASENGIYSLNDYFLSRGFVTVYSAGVGTQGSDGLRSVGGPSETASAVAVIEWLNGARRAFTDRTRMTTIKAWWCNHNIAMTGKSYLGTLAIAAATSGVAGLKTVISESAISSWYDYYRENGLVVAPGGFQGEDADVLAVDTFSRLQQAGDMLGIQAKWEASLQAISANQDRTTGDYNAWWDARNYRNHLKDIRCDIVSVHGLNDTNVKPANVIRLFNGLKDLPIQKKLFLHQGQHVYLNNVLSLDFTDQMNLWLTNKLLGVNNGANNAIPNVQVQDNVTPQTWHTYDAFGPSTTDTQNLAKNWQSDRASFADNATATFNTQHDTSASFEKAIIQPTSAYADSRLWLTRPTSTQPTVIDGTPQITLTLWIDAPTAILSVRLIDLGQAQRFGENADIVARNAYQLGYDYKTQDIVEFAKAKPTSAKLISYGHVNVQNPHNAYEIQTITPGEPFSVTFDLQPTHYVLPAGRQLALIIHGADMAQTIRPTAVVNYHLDYAHSQLALPLR